MSAIAAGVDWARQQGMNIANMSLSGSSDSSTLRNACGAARDAGVLLVAAAGNAGDDDTSTPEIAYPAAYESVVAVGATDQSDRLAWFSSTGTFLDISAPGVSVPSTYKSGGYATASGTSMASPHAAGLAALLWNSVPAGSTIRDVLLQHVVDLGPEGRDDGFGAGRASYSGQ
jgi:subtilisin family serine protease